jgi:hypothetical protein
LKKLLCGVAVGSGVAVAIGVAVAVAVGVAVAVAVALAVGVAVATFLVVGGLCAGLTVSAFSPAGEAAEGAVLVAVAVADGVGVAVAVAVAVAVLAGVAVAVAGVAAVGVAGTSNVVVADFVEAPAGRRAITPLRAPKLSMLATVTPFLRTCSRRSASSLGSCGGVRPPAPPAGVARRGDSAMIYFLLIVGGAACD